VNRTKRFEKLFEPYHIGKVQTKNRLIKTAAEANSADKGGFVSQKNKAFYESLAKGGIGTIVVEACLVDYPLDVGQPNRLRLDDDKYIPGFYELTQLIHRYNCRAFLQTGHSGIWHPPVPGVQLVSSSALTREEMPPTETGLPDYEIPRALTIPEIEEIINRFAKLAGRAREAGFDGIEINGAGGHGINSFLSCIWNKRQDQYGCQNLENRARLFVEIIKASKIIAGQDYPVIALMNGAEYGVANGTTIQEAQEFARLLQSSGTDAFHIRGFGYGDNTLKQWLEHVYYPEPPISLVKGLDWSHKGAGAQVPLATAIKKVVSVPVITVGRLDPILGEQVLREGKADFIGMTRRMFADPELPNKASSGNLDDVAPCTACLHCASTIVLGNSLGCRINAALGGAEDYGVSPAKKKKKIVVIGGGPGGMEAARVAALRGHQVTLYEKEPKLGGLLPLAAMVKGTEIEDLPSLVKYLETQITKLGVDIRLGKEYKSSMIGEIKPDVVIVAVGGKATVPQIPGIDRKNVVHLTKLDKLLNTSIRLLGANSVRRLTKLWMPSGKSVVIIGGEFHGCELAEFLVKRGKKVTIVHSGKAETLGEKIPIIKRAYLLNWLAEKGVKIITEVKYEEITDKGLVITTKEGQIQTIETDSIMPSLVLESNTDLVKSLKGKVPEVYAVGDCFNDNRMIVDAIAEGYHTARAI
jgi:2,4-dienoyl-CoA reductase (NADPH2)